MEETNINLETAKKLIKLHGSVRKLSMLINKTLIIDFVISNQLLTLNSHH